MSNQQNQNVDQELSKIEGAQVSNSLFDANTFLGRVNGEQVARGQVRRRGAHYKATINVEDAVFLLKHLDEFKKAVLAAHKMATRDGETERLKAQKAKKGSKSKPSNDDLDAELAALTS